MSPQRVLHEHAAWNLAHKLPAVSQSACATDCFGGHLPFQMSAISLQQQYNSPTWSKLKWAGAVHSNTYAICTQLLLTALKVVIGFPSNPVTAFTSNTTHCNSSCQCNMDSWCNRACAVGSPTSSERMSASISFLARWYRCRSMRLTATERPCRLPSYTTVPWLPYPNTCGPT